jgi:hypothetical protein
MIHIEVLHSLKDPGLASDYIQLGLLVNIDSFFKFLCSSSCIALDLPNLRGPLNLHNEILHGFCNSGRCTSIQEIEYYIRMKGIELFYI